MLHTETVEPRTLELLKKLMGSKLLEEFDLAGGTALALQIGHRVSVDLDFFGNQVIDSNLLLEEFSSYGQVQELNIADKIFQISINDIKLDVVNYKFDLLSPALNIDGIRLLAKEDIAAMKLSAIAGRGSKKDFVDLYFLLQEFSLGNILNFAQKKFTNKNLFHIVKSLTFFDDAEQEPDLKMLKEVSWDKVKAFIEENVAETSFDNL